VDAAVNVVLYLPKTTLLCCCIHRRDYSDRTYIRCCPVRAWI